MLLRQNPFDVTRDDQPILEHSIKDPVQTGIKFKLEFEGWEACVGAGLDIEKWESGEYSTKLMNRTVAWWRLHNAKSINEQDAVARKAARK